MTSRSASRPLTVLCVATYLKGEPFLEECRRLGCRVLLLTADVLEQAAWPREAIDAVYTIGRGASADDVRRAVGSIARRERIDRIVALDDFDVETAALMREHLRVPGMGDTTARYFRDKLAMRARARSQGILVPDFVHTVNDQAVAEWTARVPPPWFLKPRSSAAAIGIQKIEDAGRLHERLDALGDDRAGYLLEQYVAGDVFHVDSIVFEGVVAFAVAMKYGRPPFEIAHQGGIFITRRLPDDSPEAAALTDLNQTLLHAFGLQRGVSHTEFIRGTDGRWYFLETSARVGGAYIVEVIEAATGVNLWREWARLEVAGEEGSYRVPPRQDRCAGIALSLARQPEPDTSAYTEPEIVYRVRKDHHVGLIVASPDPARVDALLDEYARRFHADFYATAPAPDSPTQ